MGVVPYSHADWGAINCLTLNGDRFSKRFTNINYRVAWDSFECHVYINEVDFETLLKTVRAQLHQRRPCSWHKAPVPVPFGLLGHCNMSPSVRFHTLFFPLAQSSHHITSISTCSPDKLPQANHTHSDLEVPCKEVQPILISLFPAIVRSA